MDEQGLASVAAYGSGAGNTVTHYYYGDRKKDGKKKRNKDKK